MNNYKELSKEILKKDLIIVSKKDGVEYKINILDLEDDFCIIEYIKNKYKIYVPIPSILSKFWLKVEAKEQDNVNNPTHYTQGGIQPIDYIIENNLDFLEGNVVKYVTRYKFKNGLEDLKKAKFYLEKLIKREEK